MSLHQHFFEHMRALQLALKQSCQRRIVVISGTTNSCFTIMNDLCMQLEQCKGLLISEPGLSAVDTMDYPRLSTLPLVPAQKLKQHLGQEVGMLIWDGFSGLNPDALGIASGLLKGGGIFFLLLPEFKELIVRFDPDYLRMCADDNLVKRCQTFFLQRLVKHIQDDPSVIIYPVSEPQKFRPAQLQLPAANVPDLPTPDQLSALDMICKAAIGHRYRPLVLLADRGRGKSSVLGMAAAQLTIQHGFNIAISAPDKTTCQSAFVHYQRLIDSVELDDDAKLAAGEALRFIPLDQLRERSSEFHLVLIDEAAAVPIPLLQNLLESHPRLVFATTLQGYEGHGQGFSIRFRQTLDSTTPQWKEIRLKTPVRWLDHDVVEQWFFRFLLLNASGSERSSISSNTAVSIQSDISSSEFDIIWINQHELARNEAFFASVFSLLVSAHYQTKPSDIRLILDHPQVKLAVAQARIGPNLTSSRDANHKQILGVMLILEEGGQPPELASDIIAGTRRPRGHLFPQALCASSGKAACLSQRTYRIARIAVDLNARQKGIGSAMLAAAGELAKTNKIDSLSSSFGLRPELLHFWSKNHFQMVKLGLHPDGASGSQSIMLMRPLSEAANALSIELSADFQSYFRFNLARLYQSLDYRNCQAILENLTLGTEITDTQNKLVTPTLQAFAFAHRSFEESNQEIFDFVLASLASPAWAKLDSHSVQLVVMKVLQGHSSAHCSQHLPWKGKKQLEQALRKALQVLLSN